MPAILALSFESVDAATGVLAADVVRLLRQLTGLPIFACEVGVDRTSRYVGARVALRSELKPDAARRLTFWAARARGRVRVFGSEEGEDAAAFLSRLESCEFFLASAGLLHAAAAIQAICQRSERIEIRSSSPLDEPVLVLCVGGPTADGLSYAPDRHELFVPTALSPPSGDECVVQLVAPGCEPMSVRATVVARPVGDDGPPMAGFVLAFADAAAHALLRERVGHTDIGSSSRRRAPRHRVHGTVRIRDVESSGTATRSSEGSHQAFMRDISAGGAFVQTNAPRAVGDHVHVEARLPDGTELRTSATVVHARADGMGLRFDAPDECADALAVAMSELGGRPPRILLVDDDALVREMLSDAFRARGYDVVTAANGTLGIHALTDQLFTLDLLVTDVFMEGIDGERLIRTIRTFGGERDLPILVVTASLQSHLAGRLCELGANDVVLKSEGIGRIVAAAESLLAARGAVRAVIGQPSADEHLQLAAAPSHAAARRMCTC